MSTTAKLKLNAEKPFWLLNAPEHTVGIFDGFSPKTKIGAKDQIAQAVVFVYNSADLNEYINHISGRVTADVLLWLAYPKKSCKIKSDLERDTFMEMVPGFEAVSLVAIDDQWSAMRFRKEGTIKNPVRAVPMEERKTKGIDYVNRTAELPEDALKAMKSYKGLADFFDSMAFTHKKEYVEAIEDAKKPETRQRRIETMISKLVEMREQKELKKKKQNNEQERSN